MRLLPALLLLAAPLAAQDVTDCDPPPSVLDLVEPWEETAAVLAEGAVRVAVIEAGRGVVQLMVLTLPPVPAPAEGAQEALPETPAETPAEPPPRRCRLVAEGGLGFASLDLAGLATQEDAEAGTFALSVPALLFIPESSELQEAMLRLTFGVADDSLAALLDTGGETDGGP